MNGNLDLEAGQEKSRSSWRLHFQPKSEKNALLVDAATIVPAITASGQDFLNCAKGPSLDWYPLSLNDRLQSIPSWISNSLASTTTVTLTIATLARERHTLEQMIERLVTEGLVVSKGDIEPRKVAFAITFACLGWLSMLYEPDLTKTTSTQIAIVDVLDGYPSAAYFKLTQRAPEIRRTIPDVLLGFGLMLPKENVFTGEDDEDVQGAEKIAIVTPGGLNAANLISLAGLKIHWVDVIAPHLELDRATNTLFLYRYASFCAANLPADSDSNHRGVIHSLATDSSEPNDRSQWASEVETTGMLREILLSYRLLFAQDKTSRRLFKSTNPFEGVRPEMQDRFLERICTAKSIEIPSLSQDRESYRLSRDFPVLRERLATLQQQLNNVKPRGWKFVWRDKRDTVQWWTFWAVIFFGGVGLILSAMQVVLQFVQIFYPRP